MSLGRARFGAVVSLLALALLLACAPKRTATTEIVFWQFWPAEVVEPLLRAFEHEHPGTKVRMEQLTWQAGQEKITAAIAAGTVPDLCEVGSTWMPRLLAGGLLENWTTETAGLRPALRGWELCAVGDSIHGIPWVLGTRALFWNRTLFARAGLDSAKAPETWDELRGAAAAIQRLGGGIHGYGVQAGERYVLSKKFLPFVWSNGGRILSDDLTRAEFDSKANREALEFYLGLAEVGMTGQQDALDREFKEGRLGVQISGAWLLKQIPKEAPELRYGVGLVPRPGTDQGDHASWAGGEVLVTFRGSKRKDQALALARFLARVDNATALSQTAKSVQPAAVGADTTTYYLQHPDEEMFLRQFAGARFTPNHPAWGDMEAAIEDEVEQALYKKKTAAQAVAGAQRRLSELVGNR